MFQVGYIVSPHSTELSVYLSIHVGQSTVETSWSLLSYLPSTFPFHAKLSIAECGKRGGKTRV